jgi:predicted PurR-regulated permease PerM
VVRALARWRIPPPVSAALVIVSLVGVCVLGVYQLAGPVQTWTTKAPQTLSTAQSRVRQLLRPIERVTQTAEQVGSAAEGVAGSKRGTPEVVLREASLTARVFGSTQKFLAATLEVLVLLYFLLAAGDLFLQKLIKVLPNLRDKRKAVEIARATESSISTYLLTASLMNVVEGTVVAIAMHLIGMPNAILWGVMAAMLEFIPYLGALAMVIILTVAGLTTFSNVGQAVLPPIVFLAINLLQANFLSPMLLGHRLALNPVALFVGLAFWFWIWGIPGAFMAVPLLAAFKIVCDHVEVLAPVGEFLGMKDERKAVT